MEGEFLFINIETNEGIQRENGDVVTESFEENTVKERRDHDFKAIGLSRKSSK